MGSEPTLTMWINTMPTTDRIMKPGKSWTTTKNFTMLQLEADYWFDMWVADQVAQDINVAPWLSLEGDVTKAEATAVDSMLFHFGGSDANGDRLTYSIFDDPTGRLRIEGQNVYLDQSFSVTEDTTYQIILKVQDPYGASDVDHIYLTVENNHSPEISNTSDVSLAENVSVGRGQSQQCMPVMQRVKPKHGPSQQAMTPTYSQSTSSTGV